MGNLITAINSHGQIAKCNHSCYNSKTTGCHCICRGRFHGLGLQRAFAILPHVQKQILKELQPHFHDIVFAYPMKQIWLLPLDSEASSDSTQPETSAPSPSTPPDAQEPSGS